MSRLSETQIQRAVFEHLAARGAPGVFAFHVPNGGYRRHVEAAIFKSMGVVAGIPDILAIHNGRVFALELKAKGGRTTDKQLATVAALREAGAVVGIAEGLDNALDTLAAWGLLRGSRGTPLTRRAPRLLQELAAAPTREEATQLCLDLDGVDERDLEQIQDIINEK